MLMLLVFHGMVVSMAEELLFVYIYISFETEIMLIDVADSRSHVYIDLFFGRRRCCGRCR